MFLIIIVFLSLSVLIIDPSVYYSYHTPKNYCVLLFTPFSFLLIYLFKFINNQQIDLKISIIELLLILRCVWLIYSNPDLIFQENIVGILLIICSVILTISVRQIADNSTSEKNTSNVFLSFYFTLWILGTIQAGVGMYQYIKFGNVQVHSVKTPLIGTIGSANGYGLFIAASILASIYIYSQFRKYYQKIIVFISQILIISAFFYNRSRGAFLALIGAMIISIVIFIRYPINFRYVPKSKLIYTFLRLNQILSNTRNRYLAIIVIFIISFFTIFFIYNLDKESSNGRLMIWELSIPMIIENPISGIGYGNYAKEYLNYQARYFRNLNNLTISYKAANLKNAHNEFFQAFFETGFLGGLIYLLIWVVAIRILYKAIKRNLDGNRIEYTVLFSLLALIFFHSFIDSVLHVIPIMILLYIVYGVIPFEVKRIDLKSRLQRIILLVFISIILFSFIIKFYYEYPGYKYWAQGVEYSKQYKWNWAIRQYRIASERLTNIGELKYHIGSALVLNGEYDLGISFLNASLENYNDKNIYLSLSLAYLKIREYTQAEKQAKIALSMFPDMLAPHLLLGEIYFYQNKFNESKLSLLKCIKRSTTIQSDKIAEISHDASRLWQKFYRSPPF